jgi:hypothetical protein
MSSSLIELTESIKEQCIEYSLTVEEVSHGNLKIFTDSASGITLVLKIKIPTDFSFYFLVRTNDIVYNGDRTDVHVIMSLMFATFLRSFESEISSSLFDIPHPVLYDEIWGRYIVPVQTPSLLGISTWPQLHQAISKLILTIVFWREFFWEFAGCPCNACLKKNYMEDNTRGYEIPIEMMHSENNQLKTSSRLNYGNRGRPKWNYFYDIQNEITVIKSEELSAYLEKIKLLSEKKLQKIDGVKGKLLLFDDLKNFLSNGSERELKRILKAIGQNSTSIGSNLFPLENMLILLSNPYIIALGRLSGINEFKIEREFLRNRHNRESQLLFPVAIFEWQDDICPDQFEGLIKALLEREPNVKSVRKASPTNQGDRGRDLLIEWNLRTENTMSDTQPPIELFKIVGQCKASNKTVGKNKVLDIRDTVETHNARGFFLAVSTQTSESLTKKMEELQSKGIWTDWWNREDIEIRLSKNLDLLPVFPKVVKAKHKVKFVDKE